MDDITRDLLVSIAAIGAILLVIYLIITTRHRERMTMLERGVGPEFFSGQSSGFTSLKAGLLCIGLALGVLTGRYLRAVWTGEAYIFSILFMGGVSLIINHFIERKAKSK